MEYYENILCISKPELTDIKPPLIKLHQYEYIVKSKPYTVARHGGGIDRPALLKYDKLAIDLQLKIKAKYFAGDDPYKHVKQNNFSNSITHDPAARDFFMNHVKPCGKRLDQKKVNQYCAEAAIFNAIREYVNNKKLFVKSLGGKPSNLFEKITDLVNSIDTNIWPHDLPTHWRRLQDKFERYTEIGYTGLLHRGEGNQHSRKVTLSIERLILSLYVMPNKPYAASVQDLYLQFLSGIIEVVDAVTGEIYDRHDFFNDKGIPITLSDSTIWAYINEPKNRVIVDKLRTGTLEFNSSHRPHHHRDLPKFSLSKISMDDRDLPRKMHDGNRVKAYYAYDVASGAIIGAAHSKLKDKSLFIDCMRDMFRFIDKHNLGVPMEMEVEHHLVNKFKDDLMKAGVIFPFVRWCNPGNSQEKYAEPMNRVKKYGYEKEYHEGIGRFYSKLEANRPKSEKIFNETNDQYKEKTYDYEILVADDIAIIILFNNDLHPNQKRYPGMSRLDVLKQNLNPNLTAIDRPILTRYIGEFTQTTIRRSQYVQVKHAMYQLPSVSVLEMLEPNNYTVEAYYMIDENGDIPSVFIYQKGEYLGQCNKIVKYNTATAEQTEADRVAYTEQAKYVSKFDATIKEGKKELSKIEIIRTQKDYSTIEVETVPVMAPCDEAQFNITDDDDGYIQARALDSI